MVVNQIKESVLFQLCGGLGNSFEIPSQAEQTDALENKMQIPKTDDSLKFKWDSADGAGDVVEAKVLAIYDSKLFKDSATAEDDDIAVIFDKTPVYGESGGQIYDCATIYKDGMEFDMRNAKVEGRSISIFEGEKRTGGT